MTVPRTVPDDHRDGDTVEAHYAGLERLECALCYEGLVYIGHLETTDEGEEVEVVTAYPCRHCKQS